MLSNLKQSLIPFKYVLKSSNKPLKKRRFNLKEQVSCCRKRNGNTMWRTKKGAHNLSLHLRQDNGSIYLDNSQVMYRESSFSLADKEDAALLLKSIGNLHM
jgi:hypothetical protein